MITPADVDNSKSQDNKRFVETIFDKLEANNMYIY
jgi:hypothetical protein